MEKADCAVFQVNITSGSIACFIFCSQVSVIAFDCVFAADDPRVSDIANSCYYQAYHLAFYNNDDISYMMYGICGSFECTTLVLLLPYFPRFALVVD
jgi:hypothetical protein